MKKKANNNCTRTSCSVNILLQMKKNPLCLALYLLAIRGNIVQLVFTRLVDLIIFALFEGVGGKDL